MKINLKYLVFIAIFAVLGFSREFLFVNINNQLFTLYYKNVGYTLPNSLGLFNDLDFTPSLNKPIFDIICLDDTNFTFRVDKIR